ncbi:uncharacterized protein LOC116428254 isoform X2 [Nomia melanderi]|uniref:uncharacterized protein LOC116428254 isoform X2 n=1 Tax=Nomia melanderi TaxID=2448451 RepID=UPI003FCC596D
MENQGFEEEQQQQPGIQSQSFPRIDFVSHASASHVPDGHVYEDILPGVEQVSRILSCPKQPQTLNPDHHNPPENPEDRVPRLSPRPSKIRSTADQEAESRFRRNLTLPFRRSSGLDPPCASSSVRVTSREKKTGWREDNAETAESVSVDKEREVSVQTQAESRPNRRRRKKDCKHCRSKAVASYDRDCEIDENEEEAVLKRNRDNRRQFQVIANDPRSKAVASSYERDREIDENEEETVLKRNRDNRRQFQVIASDPRSILDPCDLGILRTCSPALGDTRMGSDALCVFTISEKVAGSQGDQKYIEYEGDRTEKSVLSQKGRAGMRVNSIYSQDRWYKEAPIFCTDSKDGSFQISDYRGTAGEKHHLEENAVPMTQLQRANSLPVRTQTPSSQNRVNLRRSVRGEPPPHPARLRKHRHGWTLHLARPLKTSGCSRSLVLLLVVILTLLGIGAVALYIVFEPEKLQVIQQYLKSSANDTSTVETFSTGKLLTNGTSVTSSTTTTSTIKSTTSNSLIAGILLSGDQSFPENNVAGTTVKPETEASTSVNSTRYCDDCLDGEVCVALVDEEVPTCRTGLDSEDPTGCAGFCLVNKQKCHRLDVDAFRCVEVDHYCLDDEWTCANTLCIPSEKRCDGHMNCYDHSDEYNCVCDSKTHFQCGNETSCLPLEKRCDRKIDCWDAADEINCTLACPSENEFACNDGQCILKARFCDGLTDCVDGSDEPSGCQERCNKHEFTCQNSRCIAKGMKCNGIDDCGDGTDERHCKHRFP